MSSKQKKIAIIRSDNFFSPVVANRVKLVQGILAGLYRLRDFKVAGRYCSTSPVILKHCRCGNKHHQKRVEKKQMTSFGSEFCCGDLGLPFSVHSIPTLCSLLSLKLSSLCRSLYHILLCTDVLNLVAKTWDHNLWHYCTCANAVAWAWEVAGPSRSHQPNTTKTCWKLHEIQIKFSGKSG